MCNYVSSEVTNLGPNFATIRPEVDHAERARLQNQLHHEQRLAAVATLAGSLAHELNNP